MAHNRRLRQPAWDDLKTPPSSTRAELTPRPESMSEIYEEVIDLQKLMFYSTTPMQEKATTRLLNQEEFDKTYGFQRTDFSLGRHLLVSFKKMCRYKWKDWFHCLQRRIPILSWLPHYSWRQDFIDDVLGGLMVSVMCVPQALAYAMLVGIPPNYGLYTSLIPPMIYAIFGSSKHTSPGSFSIASMMIGSLVTEYGGGNYEPLSTQQVYNSTHLCCTRKMKIIEEETAVGLATGITLLVGVCQILFGVFNAGVLAVWLSDYLVQGFTAGAAIHVVLSQIKSMTGVSGVPPSTESVNFGFGRFLICFIGHIKEIKLSVCITSLICILLLLLSTYGIDRLVQKYWKSFKFPMELFLVIFSTIINYAATQSNYDWDLPIVGEVKTGFVSPRLPDMSQTANVFVSSMIIAIISFAIHIALAKMVCKSFNYTIDPNQEWLALGMMNVVSAPFGCFAGASSLGRTMTLVKFKTKSQMTTIVSVFCILLVILWASPYIKYLPKSVLSVIIVMSMKDLILPIFKSYILFELSTTDFLIFFVTLVAVLLYNLAMGLTFGVSFALLSVVFRSQWAESTCMGRIPGTFDFKGVTHYKGAVQVAGLFVFRFDAPVYFANAETFLEKVRDATEIDPPLIRAKMDQQIRRQTKDSLGQSQGLTSRCKNRIHGWFRPKKQPSNGREKVDSINCPLLSETQREKKIEFRVKNHRLENKETIDISPRCNEENIALTEIESVMMTHLILDCSCINYIDLMGQHALEQVYKDYASIRISVIFATVKSSVRQFMDKGDFHKVVPKSRMFVSVTDAVRLAQREHDVPFEKRQSSVVPEHKPIPRPEKPRSPQKSVRSKTKFEEVSPMPSSLEATQRASLAEHGQHDVLTAHENDLDHQKKRPQVRAVRREPSLQKTQTD